MSGGGIYINAIDVEILALANGHSSGTLKFAANLDK